MSRRRFETVADLYLALLRARGIEWLFANAGTDFAPIIEALARSETAGFGTPRAVAVPHETVAVGMAHGYYLVTDRPQAVMVHVDVGVANALVGLMNAARANVPILFTSGRTPYTESGRPGSRDLPIHWGQEMFDQGSLVREHVKWSYELALGDQIEDIVDRALAIAMAEPRGPVYLSLPRETLASSPARDTFSSTPRQVAPSPPHPDPSAVERAAELLAAAEHPLVIAARGTQPDDPMALARFAERFALPVVEHWPARLALPSDHPLHAGFDPSALIARADAVLVLDALVPWIPSLHSLHADCSVIQLGPDPTYSTLPLRGHRVDVALTTGLGPGLAALSPALERRTATRRGELDERRRTISSTLAAERAQRLERAARAPVPGASGMSRDWVSHCLDEATGGEALVFNELGCEPAVMTLRRPDSYFGISLAGGLGWGLPAALGAQLAARDRLVVATLGDGSYTFANPVACHQAAESLGLAVLTVVFNNGGWEAVRRSTLGLHPAGAASKSERMPLTSLQPVPRYDQVVRASRGWGERVERAEDLPAALERALHVVRDEGRQALLDVILAPV